MSNTLPTDKALRALEAQSLLDNALFKHSFKELEADLVKQIKTGDMMNDKLNIRLMLALQVLEMVEDRLKGYITDAEYEAQPIGDIDE